MLGAVVSAVTNFGLTLVVAHFVSTSVAGRFFAVTSLFLILETLGRLGADTGLVYFIARWRALGQADRVSVALRLAFRPVVAVCAVAGLGLVVFAPQVAHLIGDSEAPAAGLLRLLGVLLPVAAVYDVTMAATRGFGWMRPTVVVDKIGRAVLQLGLVALVLALSWHGALGAAWAAPYLLALAAAALLLRSALRNRLGPQGSSAVSKRVLSSEFWRFCLPRAAAGIAQVLLQRLDIVLVAAMRGPRDAAIYTAATRFLVVGQFLNQAITAPVQPRMSALLAAGHTARARELYQASTAWLVLASWPLFGLAAVLAPLYVAMFGHGYRSGAVVVVILSTAMLVASGVGLVDTVIIMAGRTSWNLATTLLALVVNVAVDVALIPRFGLIGAAVGWCGSILAANLVPLLIAARRLDMHPFGALSGRAYAICGLCWIVLPGAGYLAWHDRGALVAVALALALYVGGVWRWREQLHLGEMLRRRTRTVAP